MDHSVFRHALLLLSIVTDNVYALVGQYFQAIPALDLQLVPLGKAGMELVVLLFLVLSDSFGMGQLAFNM